MVEANFSSQVVGEKTSYPSDIKTDYKIESIIGK